MIILFLLCMCTIHLQAGQHSLTPPYTQRYMSMSRQELQQEKGMLQKKLADAHEHWHEELVCGVASRNTIGMSAVCGIVSTGIVVGMMYKIPASAIIPCISGAAAACDHCYQPDLSEQKEALQEVDRILKIKTD